MKKDIIIDFLVEQGEIVDESIGEKIDAILLQDKELIKQDLPLFFKQFFPDVDASPILNKLFLGASNDARVRIIKSYEKTPSKRSVQDFVKYFRIRFSSMERLLKHRSELTGLTSINKVRMKKDKETVSIIGMVLDKVKTKNDHYLLTLEDFTGTIRVLIHKDNQDLIPLAEDLVLDEVIGVVGQAAGDIVFSSTIIHPDVPLSKELKKSPFDNYALFLGDMHFGSKEFLDHEFKRFLTWLNGNLGTLEQRETAKKVRYLILSGDVVEGIGIYPGQENDLLIDNLVGQYTLAASYLKKVPSHIKIIICPGNHDPGRISEPQLPIDTEYAQSLWDMPNVIMVSNPAYVAVDVTNNFAGIDILLYHGGSLIYYSDAVPRIRSGGGQKAVDKILAFLLKRRHLAPSHGSTLYIPDIYEDALVIDPIPDVFVTGHVHRASASVYRNVTCINSSGWTAITEDQEKRGLEPQPGRAFLLSLKTRKVKVMNFSTTKDVKTVSERKKHKSAAPTSTDVEKKKDTKSEDS